MNTRRSPHTNVYHRYASLLGLVQGVIFVGLTTATSQLGWLIFHRCPPLQSPLASVVVVVVHIVADFLMHLFVRSAFLQMRLILCMGPKKDS